MSIVTITSSVRATETPTGYPSCCGSAPVKLTWKRKPYVALACVNPKCENHGGVLGYGEQDALERWKHYRHDWQYIALIAARAGIVEHQGQRYALTWDEGA